MTSETIIQISKNALKPLLHVAEYGPKTTKEFLIDCSILEDYNYTDIRKANSFKSLFEDIQLLTGPSVYYFEIINNPKNDDIIEKFEKYALLQNSKNTPPINLNFKKSNILYVGKVKSKMWGRLIQHLGYYKVEGTQGLQLYYWAKELNLKLKLVVFEFEPEMANLVGLVEFDLARTAKPILGKHK